MRRWNKGRGWERPESGGGITAHHRDNTRQNFFAMRENYHIKRVRRHCGDSGKAYKIKHRRQAQKIPPVQKITSKYTAQHTFFIL